MATLANTTIPDAGTLGSVSDTDAISISSTGVVAISATLDVSSATLTTSTAQKEAVVQAGPGTGTLDVSSGTLTTSTAQKQAISYTAFASTTAMIFKQNSAPTGWTKVATNDNSALRVVTGTPGTGGTQPFTTAFASWTPTITMSNDAHILSTAQLPSHTHTFGGWSSGTVNPAINSNIMTANIFGNETGGWGVANAGGVGAQTGTVGDPHTHDNTATSSAKNLDISYVDVIIATKD